MSKTKNYFQHQRQEMCSILPNNYTKVLEIGCGEGLFKNNLNQSAEYWGVEADENCALIAKKTLDTVLIGCFDDKKEALPNKHFDLIICNDVIEHMDDYLGFLQEIKAMLSNSGSLVISIPNVRYLPNLIELLLKKDWRYKEAGILDKTHLRFFTEKSLKRTLKETGWEIEGFQRINRYGSNRIGPKLISSYLGQLIFGKDSAYMQFAIRAKLN